MLRNKTFYVLCLIAVFFVSNNAFSQVLRADIPGKDVGQPRHITKSDEPVMTTRPVVNPPRDEVGSFSLNGYLGNLNAAGNYVSVPTSTDFDGNLSFDGAIEMWVYPVSYSTTPILLTKENGATSQFLIGIQSSGLLFLRINNGVGTNTGGTVIPLNQWTHIAVSWTGGSPWTVSFYVNGALSGGTASFSGTWAPNTNPLLIGSSTFWTSEFFNGSIDEVRIWQPALTAAQVATNRFISLGDGAAANASGALTSNSAYSGLISSWTFNTGGTAYDDISGHNGTYVGSAGAYGTEADQPIPYNFALFCPGTGNATSFVAAPNNAALTLTTGGTAECWIKPIVATGTQEIISKSATTNTQYMFGVTGGIPYMRFGSTPTTSTAPALQVGKWYHLAWTWTGTPGNYSITFYENGTPYGPVTNAGTMASTTDPVTIGDGQAFTSENVNGYVDEVRLWNVAHNTDQIRAAMFCSARGMTTTTGLVAAWNFDGNLNNFSATTGINGSFSTGGANLCRLSAYSNENLTGPPGTGLTAHSTVVNRLATGNPFPGGFAVRAPNAVIADLGTTTDNITMGGTGAVTSVEVFLSIQHTFVNDLTVKLTAPNATQTGLILQHGSGNGSGILTFVVDGGLVTSTAGWFAPWSNVCGPDNAMGNFGGSNVNGTWTLTVQDNAAGDSGLLLGWGIRLNGAITGIQPTSNNVPGKFALYQNYPNPFNPTTNIRFDIPKDGNVSIKVYDVLGRQVSSVVDEFKKAGEYSVSFDASNLASGAYFYKITAGDFVETKKMMLIK